MTVVSTNLGTIQAMFSGLSAPSNTQMIWYNTSDNLHYYYDTITLTWTLLKNATTTKTFANAAARAASTPDFDGQPGVQLDDNTLWTADSTTTGDWVTTIMQFPIARTIYLVNDATDQTLMGGTAKNVYVTWQEAYVAADALQVTLGGSNKVAIVVGQTVAATVGDLTLTANYNSNVIIIGTSLTGSLLGNIIASNASGSGYTLTLSAYRCTIGTITTAATGATGAGGAVSLTGDFTCGTITTTASDAANTTGTGGAVTLNSLGGDCVSGNVLTTGGSAGVSGAVTLTNKWIISGTLVTSGGTTGVAGAVSITDSKVTSSITMAHKSSTSTTSFTLSRAVVTGSISLSTTGTAGFSSVNITNSNLNAFTFTQTGASSLPTWTHRSNKGTSFTITLGASFTAGASPTISDYIISGNMTFNNNSTSGGTFDVKLINCQAARIDYGGGTGSTGNNIFTLTKCIYTATTSSLTSRAAVFTAADGGGSINVIMKDCSIPYVYVKALNGAADFTCHALTNNTDVTITCGDSSSSTFAQTWDIKSCNNDFIFNVGGEIVTDVFNVTFTDCTGTIDYNSTTKDETLDISFYNCYFSSVDIEGGATTVKAHNTDFAAFDYTGTASIVLNNMQVFTSSSTLQTIHEVALVNVGTATIDLPAAATCTLKEFVIKKVHSDAGTITVQDATSTIDGAATNTAIDTQYEFIRVKSDGVVWWTI